MGAAALLRPEAAVAGGGARVRRPGGRIGARAPQPAAARAAAAYVSEEQALDAGERTGVSLRGAGVEVDLAPVLDVADGPLGSRQFRRSTFGLAFARGLAAAREGACAKHFPGLGSASVSTDDDPHVDAVLRPCEIAGFRAAIRAAVPCVMVNHASYRELGRRRASLEPATYRMLRSLGFRGVAITNSLEIVRNPPREWPVLAICAGADLLLYTSSAGAERAIRTLSPSRGPVSSTSTSSGSSRSAPA